ncbi:MAG: VCBS repeat-containing protein [Planctomycetes bacterium]|nr:VCBS repeat-containing protein [Planctomycetota bacterium]
MRNTNNANDSIARARDFPSSLSVIFMLFCAVFARTANAQIGAIPQIAVPGGPSSIEPVDLNADGATDLVVATYSANAITILMGSNSGSFTQTLLLTPAAATKPLNAHVADLNQDGKLDLVASFSGGINAGFFVYLGDGAGGFSQLSNTQYYGNVDTRLSDWNHDGYTDILTLSSAVNILADYPCIKAFNNNGSAVFAPSTVWNITFPTITFTKATWSDIAAGDIHGNGQIGVAGTYYGGYTQGGMDQTFYYYVSGLMTYSFGTSYHNLGTTKYVSIAFGDYDQDGITDCILGDALANVNVYKMNAGVISASWFMADSPRSLQLTDVNNDSIPDLVCVSPTDHALLYRLGTGAGNYGIAHSIGTGGVAPMAVAFPVLSPFNLRVGLVANQGSDSMSAFPLSAAGIGDAHTRPVEFTEIDQPDSPAFFGVRSADLDLDGNRDLVAVGINQFTILKGHGDGTFDTTTSISVAQGLNANSGSRIFALADMNHDGRADLISTTNSAPLAICLNNGVGGFGAATTFGNSASGFDSVTMVDLDSDGNTDALVVNPAGHFVRAMRGDGSGGFTTVGDTPFGSNSGSDYRIAAGDFDGDGNPDIVKSAFQWNNLELYTGTGTGTFNSPSTIATGNYWNNRIAAGDFNFDGALDVLLESASSVSPLTSNIISIALFGGNGNGTFQNPVAGTSFSAGFVFEAAEGDMNSDGYLDAMTVVRTLHNYGQVGSTGTGGSLTTLGYTEAHANVQMSDASGGFAATMMEVPIRYNINWNKSSPVDVSDLNSDGRLDLAPAQPVVLLNSSHLPAGVSIYGAGTHGCGGAHGLMPLGEPTVGNPQFGMISTNAPPNSLGVELDCDAQNPIGTDAFSLGFTLFLDLNNATYLGSFDMTSDADGYGVGVTNIPNNPAIVGSTIYSQVLWYDPSCPATFFGLTSSPGAAVTIQ